jgi:GAF domain-containing protein
MFDDADAEPEPTLEEIDLLPEEKIVSILGSKPREEEVAVEPTVMEDVPFIPTFIPPSLEQVEGESVDEWQEAQQTSTDFLTWEIQLQEQRVRVMNIMLSSLASMGTLIVVFSLVNLLKEPSWRLGTYVPYVPYFAAYVVLVILALARRLNPTTRAAVLIALAYSLGIAVLLMEGPMSAGGFYLVATPLMSATLLRHRVGAVATAASCLIYAGFLLGDYAGWFHPSDHYEPDALLSILSPIGAFSLAIACIMFVQWMSHQTLTSALREAREQHEGSVRSWSLLKTRATELGKTNALLQKRTLQLQTTAQVSSAAIFSELDPDELVRQVVNLIQDRFDLYYVGLFLIDDVEVEGDLQWARLRAGTGEAGRQMLAMEYKIAVNVSTPVGWCVVNAKPQITKDIGSIHLASSSEHVKATRLLSDTRAEMALPLRTRGRVIGALVLRSTEREAFLQEDVPVLQTMADQVAVAIDNTQLYAEAQARLREVQEVQRRYVREQWAEFLDTQVSPAYERAKPNVPSLEDSALPEMEQVMARREMIVKSNTSDETEQAALIVPIRLRDEAIGVLGLQETESGRQWTEDEVALIESVADQMALAIENARLLANTQQRAERERIIARITARVRASMDPETILQTAVRELGVALSTDRAFVQLGASQTNEET